MGRIAYKMVGKKRSKKTKRKPKVKAKSRSVKAHRAGKVRAPISRGKWA